ncbi:MAG: acyl-CoA dehydrogenase, partial [Desulfobacterales bacterium]|nr:acyl-CoA dehydrogenase [Desulfobacterales bacterium]
MCKADKIISTAVTEAAGGSDPQAMQSTARVDGDDYLVNGRKIYISFAEVADLVCTVAKMDGKFSAFIVEKGTPGFEITRRERHNGLRSIPVNEFVLTDCRIPRINLVGQEGKGL